MAPLSAGEFAALMAPLGPFEPHPHLALAVSGGADSLALALLAAAWARAQGGSATGLVVDHGLRALSAAEAALACDRLAAHGIPSRLLRLHDLQAGPALAERAREARHAALHTACAEAGLLHLLLGHHAADQAETLAMRQAAGSGPSGLAGMAALVETATLRLLRPLLPIPPGRLRATLRAAGQPWSEDPSNADLQALRPRLRAQHADPEGDGPTIRARLREAAHLGALRQATEAQIADELARRISFHPEGFAMLSPGPIAAASLAAALRMLAGRRYPLPAAAVARLAANPTPATLGGVRILPARAKAGWLLLREAAAMAPPVPAIPGATWDRRFRLDAENLPSDARFGALGSAPDLRRTTDLPACRLPACRLPASRLPACRLPAALLQTLPALRIGAELVAVPHLRYWRNGWNTVRAVWTAPPVPAAPAPFVCANFTFADQADDQHDQADHPGLLSLGM